MSDLFPAYVVNHEAWYHQHLPAQMQDQSINVQSASTGGGVAWEFEVERVPDIGIRLGMFDDSWDAFTEYPDLFRELQALGKGTNLDEIRDVLDRLGFKDITQRVDVSAPQGKDSSPS